MNDDFYPMVSVYMTLPKRIDGMRPTSTSGDQNTYTIRMGDNNGVSVYAFATLEQMLEFANEIEKFVHREQR